MDLGPEEEIIQIPQPEHVPDTVPEETPAEQPKVPA